jgi:5-methylcytosine-specific restriction enzyme subunit McrC
VKIPIANVYYLLCYAWQHVEETDVVDVTELDGLENVHDLLGKVLAEGTFQLLRRGLDRGYREVQEDLPGIRGKLAISEMASRALKARGRAACVFEELSHDVTHNRILRSTLASLLRIKNLDNDVRAEVGTAFRKLEGISVVRVDRQLFGQLQLDGNRRVYRFLMAICALIHEHLLVDDTVGDASFRDFRDDYERMWKLFEDFVTEFYRREQTDFTVNKGGRKIPWHDAWAPTEADEAKIPGMFADVLLDSPERRIILDTKFYPKAFSGRWGGQKLHSSNIYQLLAYLRNRDATAPEGAKHEGILLYPVVETPIATDVRLEGFRIQARGIDLGQPWAGVYRDMLEITDAPGH